MSYFNIPTAVYRCYDKNGGLLYIGITGNPWRRMKGHRVGGWMLTCIRMDLTWYKNRTLAGQAELLAIKQEKPKHNEQGLKVRPRRIIKLYDDPWTGCTVIRKRGDPV